jgi:hypothetical protein
MRVMLWILLFSVISLLMGCASKITRSGYSLQDEDQYKNFGCNVAIKKDFVYNKDDVETLGEIKAGDSGFSFDCGKKYVLSLFKKEACALSADLINIIYERNIDLWSSCYRAKAQFLRFKDREKAQNLESDAAYR